MLVSSFVLTLWDILNKNPSVSGVKWLHCGKKFVVEKPELLVESFAARGCNIKFEDIRLELVKHGFKETATESEKEFSHPYFLRDDPASCNSFLPVDYHYSAADSSSAKNSFSNVSDNRFVEGLMKLFLATMTSFSQQVTQLKSDVSECKKVAEEATSTNKILKREIAELRNQKTSPSCPCRERQLTTSLLMSSLNGQIKESLEGLVRVHLSPTSANPANYVNELLTKHLVPIFVLLNNKFQRGIEYFLNPCRGLSQSAGYQTEMYRRPYRPFGVPVSSTEKLKKDNFKLGGSRTKSGGTVAAARRPSGKISPSVSTKNHVFTITPRSVIPSTNSNAHSFIGLEESLNSRSETSVSEACSSTFLHPSNSTMSFTSFGSLLHRKNTRGNVPIGCKRIAITSLQSVNASKKHCNTPSPSYTVSQFPLLTVKTPLHRPKMSIQRGANSGFSTTVGTFSDHAKRSISDCNQQKTSLQEVSNSVMAELRNRMPMERAPVVRESGTSMMAACDLYFQDPSCRFESMQLGDATAVSVAPVKEEALDQFSSFDDLAPPQYMSNVVERDKAA